MSKRNKAADRAAERAERAARAAALKAEQERKEKRRRLLTFGGVAAVLLLIVGVAIFLQTRAGQLDEGAVVPAGSTKDFGMQVGDADAKHEVVIYEDFICPACKLFKDENDAALEAAVADGTARVEYRPLNFLRQYGDYSGRAANAFAVVLDAAGPDVALKFHDILFANQPPESGPLPDDAWLIEKAVEAGATEVEVSEGIKGMEFEAWVENAAKTATDDGVGATPTILVDGEAIEFDGLSEALE